MPTLRPRFSNNNEGEIVKIESLFRDSDKIRVVINPKSLDGGKWNNHAMLNIDDDLFVSLERYYSLITTFSELSEAINKEVKDCNKDTFYGKTILFARCGIDANTALRENAHKSGSYRIIMSSTICRNKLRVDYDWLYISGLSLTDDEKEYRSQIVDYLRQNLGHKYKMGNYRSQAMKLTAFTNVEDNDLIRFMSKYKDGQWILHKPNKLLYHNRFSRCSEYKFKYNYEILADGAFKLFSSLETITIPNSVKYIGAGCFNSCSNLRSVQLSTNLKSIGKLCFANCISLQRIVIPNSVTEIESMAFFRNESLKEIVMSDNLQHIGWSVFEGCNDELKLYVNKENEEELEIVLNAYKDCIVVVDSEQIQELRKNCTNN